MPATTPLGIIYTCAGDTIDPGVFVDNAQSIQDAISTVQVDVDSALRPPAVQVRTDLAGQNVAAGVTATIAYQLIGYDTAAMFNPGTPTLITVTSPGTYFVACFYTQSTLATTESSARISILLNGSERAAAKYDAGSGTFSAPQPFLASAMLPGLIVGDQITTNHLFTGSGNHNIRHAVTAVKISNV